MCGITGFWNYGEANSELSYSKITRMTEVIAHRGPDDDGIWIDPEFGLAVGHRRLSILDLSAAGHQPMTSHSGRWIISFNGEIYNHLDIRRKLSTSSTSLPWRGYSDTETLLAAIEYWGLEHALDLVVGMFAFALWDRKEKKLTLVRDRFGEKPLYYGYQNNTFLFASELKALKAYPNFNAEICLDSLASYFRLSYIPAPYTIYKNISKLMPGSFLTVTLENVTNRIIPEPKQYWSAVSTAYSGLANSFTGSFCEAADALDNELSRSINDQRISDVPVGVFLSGGIDSTIVAAYLQKHSANAIKSFSIGFKEENYNEAHHAMSIAKYLGTDHTELYVSADQALSVVSKLPFIYDEPFADSSQIPTFLVSELASTSVKVALSGDGGDELFCGYNRYNKASQIFSFLNTVPSAKRALLSSILSSLNPNTVERYYSLLKLLLPSRYRTLSVADKLSKLGVALSSSGPGSIYENLISHCTNPNDFVLSSREHKLATAIYSGIIDDLDIRSWMMLLDTVSYLPDDILVKVDRSSMSASLETRSPLLDHRLFHFAWTLPISYKHRNGVSKAILKRVLSRYIPDKYFTRPKMGFGIPLDTWLRGPLKEWADELLNPLLISDSGFIDPCHVKLLWEQHLSGKYNWQYCLWDILMWQSWIRVQ